MVMISKSHLSILFLILSNIVYSQVYNLSGKVLSSKDSIILSNANVLIQPLNDKSDIRFTITDRNGDFNLDLDNNNKYQISISYLGFQKFIDTINNTNFQKYYLKEFETELDEVILVQKIPLIIKEDTLIYDVESFQRGNERKLKQLLANLPGIDIDELGEVFVKGKRVTNVTVENRKFYNGTSKLAIENIPAYVVNKVEFISNYNPIALLRGLEESEDVNMNIKLKEDRKNFLFGDIDGSLGLPHNKYVFHPSLFFYSPKSDFTLMGDINNIGVDAISINDFKRINPNTKSTLIKNEFSQLSKIGTSNNYNDKSNTFGAISYRKTYSKSTDINAFILYSYENIKSIKKSSNQYIKAIPIFEENSTNSNISSRNINGELSVKLIDNMKSFLNINSFVNKPIFSSKNNINTELDDNNNSISSILSYENSSFGVETSFNHKWSENQSIAGNFSLNNINELHKRNWNSSNLLFNNFSEFNSKFIEQQTKVFLNTLEFNVKDYWVINNLNHIYFSFGAINKNESMENQIGLANNSIYIPSESLDYSNLYTGIEYKFLINQLTIKPSFYVRKMFWTNSGLNNSITNFIHSFDLFTSYEFKTKDKLILNLTTNFRFPDIEKLRSFYIINSYNTVSVGNPKLLFSTYKNATLRYSKFNLIRNSLVSFFINYKLDTNTIKNVIEINPNEIKLSYKNYYRPENSIGLRSLLEKRIGSFKFSYLNNLSLNKFYNLFLDRAELSSLSNLSNTFKIRSRVKSLPEIELIYNTQLNKYTSVNSQIFHKNIFEIKSNYDKIKNTYIEANWKNTSFQGINKNSSINEINFNIDYKKEDSRFAYSFIISNLLDKRTINTNFWSDFVLSESEEWILPRIIRLSVSYKL